MQEVDKPKLQPLVAIIGWTQNLIILQRCKNPLEREFYIRTTTKFGWTKNILIHQIENQGYEKTLLGQTNFDKAQETLGTFVLRVHCGGMDKRPVSLYATLN